MWMVPRICCCFLQKAHLWPLRSDWRLWSAAPDSTEYIVMFFFFFITTGWTVLHYKHEIHCGHTWHSSVNLHWPKLIASISQQPKTAWLHRRRCSLAPFCFYDRQFWKYGNVDLLSTIIKWLHMVLWIDSCSLLQANRGLQLRLWRWFPTTINFSR